MKHKRIDKRPICRCSAYKFPHKIGGKCKGITFAEFYYYNIREHCYLCNCNNETSCDVVTGREDIKHGECYIECVQQQSDLQLTWETEDNDYL